MDATTAMMITRLVSMMGAMFIDYMNKQPENLRPPELDEFKKQLDMFETMPDLPTNND